LPVPDEEGASCPARRGNADGLRRRMLASADTASVLGALLALAALPGSAAAQLAWVAGLLPLWIAMAKLQGLYDRDHRVLRPLTVDEIPSLVTWVTVGTAVTYALFALFGAGHASASDGLRTWLVIVLAAPLLRAAARQLWRQSVPPERALIVGHGELADAVRRKLDLFPDMHVRPFDVVDEVALMPSRLPDVDRVLIAAPHVDEGLMMQLVRECRLRRVKLGLIPPAHSLFGTAVRLDYIAELPVVQYNTWDVLRSTQWLKRTMDLVASALALSVLSPLLLLCTVAVVVDSRGSPFFTQRRAGRNGRHFRLIKFRTMAVGADRRLGEYVRLNELDQPMFKLRHDPRVTRMGRILRRTSLDELPQLLNVLLGHMSLVGPRPEQLEVVELYRPEHRFRLDVKPGLTGPMQVYGRGELTFEERLAVEREYIDNMSLRRDLHIMLLTIATVARGRGAF